MNKTKRFMYVAAGGSLALMFLFFILMVNTAERGYLTPGITFMTIGYHFTVRLFIGNVMGKLPLSRFNPDAWRFRERRFERILYKILRVRKWKKFIPSYDNGEFSLKDRSIGDIARATCRAESVHTLCVLASLVTVCFSTWFGSFIVFLITGILGAAADMVFIIVQRYNRPRLLRAMNGERTKK